MTDWYLEVSSYAGFVPGASHYRGRVKEEFAVSCHGGTRFNGGGDGKTTCFEGHELRAPSEWDVDDFWTEAHYKRYRASGFEDAGPAQFTSEARVLAVAVARFLGQVPDEQVDRWWEEKGIQGKPGDRLIYGGRAYVLEDETLHEEWRNGTMPEVYPAVIAVVGVTGKQEEL